MLEIQLELYRRAPPANDAAKIRFYETFLAQKPRAHSPPFARQNEGNPEDFHVIRDYGVLAHRLMRLYAKTGQTEKLSKLGLQFAKFQEPFTLYSVNGIAGVPERVIGTLIEHADDQTLAELARLLENADEQWLSHPTYAAQIHAMRAHARFVRNGGIDAVLGAAKPSRIPWRNLPKGVHAIVSFESGLALTRNETHAFAGFPWGVARYDFDGNLTDCLLLDGIPQCLAANQTHLFAGTDSGLREIDLQSWEVTAIEGEIRDFGDLALQGNFVWMRGSGRAERYNRLTNELISYSRQDFGETDPFGVFWPEEDGSVWLGGHRFDPKSETWRKIAFVHDGPRVPQESSSVRYLGCYDGIHFADVNRRLPGNPHRDDFQPRLAQIDPNTITARFVPFSDTVDVEARVLRENEINYRGRIAGQLCFGNYVLNPETGLLETPTPDPKLLPEASPNITDTRIESQIPYLLRETPFPAERYSHRSGQASPIGLFRDRESRGLLLPNGKAIFVYAHVDRFPDKYDAELANQPHHGLFWIENGEMRRLPSPGLQAQWVFAAVPGKAEHGVWLATSNGVSLVNPNTGVTLSFGRNHGVPATYVCHAEAETSGRIRFTSKIGENAGPVAIFEPERIRISRTISEPR